MAESDHVQDSQQMEVWTNPAKFDVNQSCSYFYAWF